MAFINNHHLSGIELHGHAHSSPTYCMRPCYCPKFINEESIVEKTYYSKNIYTLLQVKWLSLESWFSKIERAHLLLSSYSEALMVIYWYSLFQKFCSVVFCTHFSYATICIWENIQSINSNLVSSSNLFQDETTIYS